jgi:hypothetical protein
MAKVSDDIDDKLAAWIVRVGDTHKREGARLVRDHAHLDPTS